MKNYRSSEVNISVVIAYHQQGEGPLARALRSIASQSHLNEIEIIVVDDSSPNPPAADIAMARLPERLSPTVIRQANKGPGGARNAGLAQARGRIIAFLDSDDAWQTEHLERAQSSISSGSDVYICKLASPEFPSNDRAWNEQWNTLLSLLPRGTLPHSYITDNASACIEPLMLASHLSCLCYRRDFAPDLTFDERARWAGEDFGFLFRLFLRDPQVTVSEFAPACQGRGSNMFSGLEYGSPEAARANWSSFQSYRRLAPLAKSNTPMLDYLNQRIAENRRACTAMALHWLRRHPHIGIAMLARRAIMDPRILPIFICSVIARLSPSRR